MNKKPIWVLMGIIVIGIVIVMAVSRSGTGVSERSIKIGAVLSLSGDAAQDGESIKDGIELARKDLKARGVNVDVEYQDDKTDAKTTVSAMQAVGVMGVEAVIGPTWSFLADAGVPVADQLKLVSVMPANTSEYVGSRSSYAFFTTIKVAQLVAPLTQWFKEHNIKSIAVIRNQGAWYDTVNNAVTAAAEQAGAKIVYSESLQFGNEASAMATVIAKVKAAKADLFFTEIDSDKGVSVMLKKLQEQGISTDIMSVTTSIGRVLNGGEFTQNSLKNSFYVAAPRTSQAFQDKYQAAYSKTPSAYADTAYDSLMFIVDAIRNKGSVSLVDYLHTKTDYQGYANKYSFDSNGDIKGGEWVVKKLE